MMYSEGAIIPQIQEIYKEEISRSISKYQQLENGWYDPFIDIKHIMRRIDMETEILIALECSHLFHAVRSYKTCPKCQGDRYVWTGSDSYRCPYCNINGEVEA